MLVEVDTKEVAREADDVVRGYARKARVPGFRSGKVPKAVILARFGKEVQEDVRERVVARYYQEATREKGLRPLGEPILEEINYEEGQPLSFKTTFEVAPEIQLKSYKGIEVRRPGTRVAGAEIDQALDELRESRVQLITEEGRKAVTGDVIVADVQGQPGDGEPFSRERMMIEVGASNNLPAFNEQLDGVLAGAELEFTVDYPKEYPAANLAGQSVAYRLQVHEVKRRELPALDDEFAKDLGEFEDLAALRTQIGEDLEHRKQHEAEGAVRQSLLDKVLLENPIVLPEVLVEDEIRSRLEEIVRRMMAQGMDPQKAELDWKELRDRQEQGARKAVHARLVLDAIAEAESVEVTDGEVNDRLRRDAEAMGEKLETLRARVRQHGGLEVLKRQLVREKSLDLLTAVANIQIEEIEE
jgi:trigger factor